MTQITHRQVALWKTKGKDFIELIHDAAGYSYRGNNCGGVLPKIDTDNAAIAYMERPLGPDGAGPVTVLKTDRPSLTKVK